MRCSTEILPVMRAQSREKNTIYLYQARCKSWECPKCGPINKLTWIARISQGIDEYQSDGVVDWMFCTVTSHPKLKSQYRCLWVEPKAWKKLWSRIRYHHGKVSYVYIPELHKNGRVHWHMLMSGGIQKSWWKHHAPRCGFGYMFDSQPVVDGHNSVLYVSKELNKSLARTKWPRGLRRIRTNHHWPELPNTDDFQDEELNWFYMRTHPQRNMEQLRREIEEFEGMTTVLLSETGDE